MSTIYLQHSGTVMGALRKLALCLLVLPLALNGLVGYYVPDRAAAPQTPDSAQAQSF